MKLKPKQKELVIYGVITAAVGLFVYITKNKKLEADAQIRQDITYASRAGTGPAVAGYVRVP